MLAAGGVCTLAWGQERVWPDKDPAYARVCWGQKGDELVEVSRRQNLTVPVCCDNPLDVNLQEMRVLEGSGSRAMLSSVCFS